MRDEDIKAVVLQTIESLPDDIKKQLSELVVTIEERPPVQVIVHEQYSHKPQPPQFYKVALPDKIMIYKSPLLRISSTLEEARGHVKDAIIKEISNYFGVSEFELRRVKSTL